RRKVGSGIRRILCPLRTRWSRPVGPDSVELSRGARGQPARPRSYRLRPLQDAAEGIDRIVTDAHSIQSGTGMPGEQSPARRHAIGVDLVITRLDIDHDLTADVLRGLDQWPQALLVQLLAAA